MRSAQRGAITALVLVNLLWGFSFPVMTMINRRVDRQAAAQGADPAAPRGQMTWRVLSASFYMTWRFAMALAILAVAMPGLFWPMSRAEWLMGAATGAALSGGFILQVVALHEIPASRSGFLTSLSVVFTPLLMIVLERRPPRGAVIAGAALALAGMAILTGMMELRGGLRLAADATERIGSGDWLTVLAALIFAVEIILIDVFSRRMPSAKLTPGMFLATVAIGVATFVLASRTAAAPAAMPLATWGRLMLDPPLLVLTLLTSVLCTVLAFHLMNKYQCYVPPAHAALIYTLEPIFATGWAVWLPGLVSPLIGIRYASERPGWETVVGGLLVIAGNGLALLGVERREERDRRRPDG